MHLRIDRVHQTRGGQIGTRIPSIDDAGLALRAERTTQQPAGLIGETVEQVGEHLVEDGGRQVEHDAEATAAPEDRAVGPRWS